MFVILDAFSKRHDPELYGDAIQAELRKRSAREIHDAVVDVFGPPPVRGVGRAGGFKIMIEDRGDFGPGASRTRPRTSWMKAKQRPGLIGLVTGLPRQRAAALSSDVEPHECMHEAASALQDVFDTLQIYLGSLYVNDFNRFGRTWQVIVQADARFRNQVEDVRQLKVRNAKGDMVPLGSLADSARSTAR